MQDFKLSFEAIGTHWVIDCFNSTANEDYLKSKILNRILEFDKTYSRFREDSLVWKISEKTGVYKFPSDSRDFFSFYDQLYKITDGKFTLLVGNALSESGYDANYSLKPQKINKIPAIESVYSWEYPSLTVKKPYILDFGGLGKGYLIDLLSNIIKEEGVQSFIVDGGGDMFVNSLQDLVRVGLENPNDSKQVIGIIEINNKSIAASSGNRRKWDKYHHIFDPDTLSSPNEVIATWVIANEAITADGLATCLFLVPPQKLTKYFDFEYLILRPDFTFEKSKNFTAELFLK